MNEIKNKLMKRNEIELVIESASNPGFAHAIKEVAKHSKASEEQIVVKRISSSFGRNKFKIEANIYESAKDKIQLEPRKKEKAKTPAGN